MCQKNAHPLTYVASANEQRAKKMKNEKKNKYQLKSAEYVIINCANDRHTHATMLH